jgi:hypothetical protein
MVDMKPDVVKDVLSMLDMTGKVGENTVPILWKKSGITLIHSDPFSIRNPVIAVNLEGVLRRKVKNNPLPQNPSHCNRCHY